MDDKINNICTLCVQETMSNNIIVCPFCKIDICETCFQYGITMELKNPCCIYCHKMLSLEFILSNNDTEWCQKIFIPYFENLCLEKEKMLLPDSIEQYKNMLLVKDLKQQRAQLLTNKQIENKLKPLKKIVENYEYELKKQIQKRNVEKQKLTNEIYELDPSRENITLKKHKSETFISKCSNGDCKGFITNKYICNICDVSLCQACMVVKNNNDHECDRNDIESAKLIKESSKPCPTCYVSIFKISGCNQMFCTNCHAVFDWNTMIIDNGSVHNVHYFEWVSSMHKKSDNDNEHMENMACGNIEDIYSIAIMRFHEINVNSHIYLRNTAFRVIFQKNRVFHGEIIPLLQKLIKNKYNDYRIQYLDDKITEEKWKTKIVKDTIENEKNNSFIQILEMYVNVTSDFIRQFAYKTINHDEFKKIYTNFNIHFTKCLYDTCQIFGGDLPKIISNHI